MLNDEELTEFNKELNALCDKYNCVIVPMSQLQSTGTVEIKNFAVKRRPAPQIIENTLPQEEKKSYTPEEVREKAPTLSAFRDALEYEKIQKKKEADPLIPFMGDRGKKSPIIN